MDAGDRSVPESVRTAEPTEKEKSTDSTESTEIAQLFLTLGFPWELPREV